MSALVTASDIDKITLQMGRSPRGDVTVAVRCTRRMPQVIRTEARLTDGSPFPTLFWLTCPVLSRDVARLEADGMIAELQSRVDTEPDLAQGLREAAEAYTRAQGDDGRPGSGTRGIGGASDPLRVKCLHSHYAHYLATGANPIGLAVAEALRPVDPDLEPACENCSR